MFDNLSISFPVFFSGFQNKLKKWQKGSAVSSPSCHVHNIYDYLLNYRDTHDIAHAAPVGHYVGGRDPCRQHHDIA